MTDEGTGQDSWRAPYLPYGTLTNFLDNKVASGAVPPRIDRTFLENYSGSVRPLILAALKTVGMIDGEGKVLPLLREAVRNPPQSRQAILRSWAEQFYSRQIELAKENDTAQMLWESFSERGFNGSTLRRAVIFYLALSEDLGLPVSPHFKSPKAPSSAGGAVRKRGASKSGAGRGGSAPTSPPSPTATFEQTAGDTYEVTLPSGPKVTLTVKMDVMRTSVADRNFIFEVVDKLRDYAASSEQASGAETVGTDDEDEAEDLT
jgi:hypothetical protein